MDAVSVNYEWFDRNRNSIIENHYNEYVLIHNQSIVDYFKTEQGGLVYAEKNNIQLGDFVLQQCITEQEETGYYANWRVCFA